MQRFQQLFHHKRCPIIGMVHLQALPGAPKYRENTVEKVVSQALREAEIYANHHIDGILIENMHDLPYAQAEQVGPETTAIMARICYQIRQLIPKSIPCGVQVLAGANKQAVAIAKSCGLDFVRVEGYVFAHVADEGFTNAQSPSLMRYKRFIDADNVLLFADIKKKHSSHALTADVSLIQTAQAAEMFLTNAIVLTGSMTGESVPVKDVCDIKKAVVLPVIIGSGVKSNNIQHYVKCNVDAVIVGSDLKVDGKWSNEICEKRILKLMEARHYCD